MLSSINYDTYRCKAIQNRTFSYQDVQNIIENLANKNDFKTIESSFEGREIKLCKLGNGNIKILFWSQMHGDEPTATAALFDLINFFNDETNTLSREILKACTLYIIPVLNPDGLEKFTRRNAQEIDINRDYLAEQSPEGKILKQIRTQVKPDFAFNLHDQNSLYSIPKTKKQVGISLLAPAFDGTLSVNWTREQAMKVIVCINETLQQLIPNQVAKFNDEFEPRAFGDNFQKAGTPTILIESGALKNEEEKQEVRKLNFFAILSALESISNQNYQNKDLMNYLMIPVQKKELFHVLIKDCEFKIDNQKYKTDIGINYQEIFNADDRSLRKEFTIADMGDLSAYDGFEVLNAEDLIIKGNPKFELLANFSVQNEKGKLIIGFNLGSRI
jgi:hypothetical protein